jgi:hypothetical protein
MSREFQSQATTDTNKIRLLSQQQRQPESVIPDSFNKDLIEL